MARLVSGLSKGNPATSMPPPRAVTFDCWNTLLVEEDWGLAHRRRVEALHEVARKAGRAPEETLVEDAFRLAWGRHMELWEEGVATGASHVAGWALAHLGLEASDGVHSLTRHFEEASHSGRVVALDGARETLDTLRGLDIPLALICDTGLTPGRVVRKHLDRLGLLSNLSAQIFSDEVGVPKPDAQIFAEALAALRVPAAGSVHVGDLLRTDIAGARNAGMGSVRLRANHDDESDLPEADHVADSHRDLVALLTSGL